ncbi:hypothetical protein CEK62_17905 [Alcanivorax sp. N3-2A]|nr:hypothetical protein CEK62_17905 [Alcanivorax sp. N3-2A]|tara:strand:- start:8940 stop:10448 length:1509 start_codon:yes stop_codon:yes gene_type:complete
MDAFLNALSMLAAVDVLIAVVSGTLVGIVIGALPGLGSLLAITMVLPLTFVLGQGASIALLLGIYCGSVYGGSLSAILINTPGTPQSAATVLDGYPMAKRGDAGLALGWSTTASAFGGIFATVILAVASPLLAKVGLRFGPVEYFALGLFALTCIVSVSRDNLAKGLIAGLLGLFVAVVGQDPVTGALRYDFGVFDLSAGIGLVPFLVGLFALSEVFWRAAEKTDPDAAGIIPSAFQLPSLKELRHRMGMLVKSSLIGTWIGTLPGVGASSASMVSYAEAKRSSRYKDKFGTGEPDGLIASEASNNAVTSGAMVPTLSLGVPGDPITAVMLGALVLQGVTPGPRLFLENQSLVLFIFLMLFLANICLFFGGMLMSPLFSKILRIPEPILMGCVVALVATGTYSINANPFDLLVVLVSGVAGFLLRYNGFPLAPVVIGFVLSGMIEQSLRQGMIMNHGNFLAFFTHPIALFLFVLTALFLFAPGLKGLWSRRRAQGDAQQKTD